MPPAPASQEGKGAPVWLVLDEVMVPCNIFIELYCWFQTDLFVFTHHLSNVIVCLNRICVFLFIYWFAVTGIYLLWQVSSLVCVLVL
jgi:hypothetical protein